MYCNYPRKTFDKIFYNSIEYGKHYALFFKDNDVYAISMNSERMYEYCSYPVLKIIDLYSLEKLEPDYAWKVFEQTLRELDVTEDF